MSWAYGRDYSLNSYQITVERQSYGRGNLNTVTISNFTRDTVTLVIRLVSIVKEIILCHASLKTRCRAACTPLVAACGD